MRTCIFLAAVAVASWSAEGRPDINGNWQLDPVHSQMTDVKIKSRTLAISQTGGSITITDTTIDAGEKSRKVGIECTLDGQDCKANGVAAKVAFYYNGPILIWLDTRRGGDMVTKIQVQPSEDGKTLTLDVMHLSPPGTKNEKLVFTKR